MGWQQDISEIRSDQRTMLTQQSEILEMLRKHDQTLYEKDTGLMKRTKDLETHNDDEQKLRNKFMLMIGLVSAGAGVFGSNLEKIANWLKP